jgi:hypothetical protein
MSEALRLAESYADAVSDHRIESLYGTSKSYTLEKSKERDAAYTELMAELRRLAGVEAELQQAREERTALLVNEQNLREELAALRAVPAIPKCIVWDRGFSWDADRQQHIPQLIVRFDPVPFDGPSDAKGWKDRDTLAAMLSASPQAPNHTEHILGMVQAAAEIRVAEANTDAADLERLRTEVARLTAALKRASEQAEHFEREWYLRGDEIEAALPAMREYARKNPKHHFSADGAEQDPNGAHAWLERNELFNTEGEHHAK